MLQPIKVQSLLRDAKMRFGDNLKAIILFGSGTGIDFVQSISDLDFIFIFETMGIEVINNLESLEFEFSEFFDSRVDIKPLTRIEIEGPIKGNLRNPFFNNWNLRMIKDGQHQVLFQSDDISFDIDVPLMEVRKDALDIASKCILKFRKLMFLKRTMILDGEVRALSDTDLAKVCVSCCKHVITFCLIYKGIECPDIDTTIQQAELMFGSMDRFRKALEMRRNGELNLNILKEAYELAEKVFAKTIT